MKARSASHQPGKSFICTHEETFEAKYLFLNVQTFLLTVFKSFVQQQQQQQNLILMAYCGSKKTTLNVKKGQTSKLK